MRSPRTLPGPTLGSWSQSPTMIRRQPSGSARSTAFKQQDVHHGKLIENEGIAIQQILFVPGKGLVIVFIPFHLQETVNRLGLLAGQIAHALRSPACGRGEQHLLSLLFQDADDRFERRRLAGAGAAGEDQQPVFKRLADGILLELRILHARLVFQLPR